MITAGTNTLLADEPESMGGQNLGFAPQELFASSLAACTIITLRMYADRKGWDLTDVKIEVTFERDIPANITKLERKIEFTGNLDEAQRARLRVIADSCPIHKALTNTVKINSKLI